MPKRVVLRLPTSTTQRAMPYLLALNCGSSSLKSQLYRYTEGDSTSLKPVAKASASNVGAKGRKVELKVSWTDSKGEDKKVEKEQADVECESTRHRHPGGGAQLMMGDVLRGRLGLARTHSRDVVEDRIEL